MNPNSLSEGFAQGGMYCLAAAIGWITIESTNMVITLLIGGSTIVLIWTNIRLNIKKTKQFDKTGSTKPGLPK